MTRFKDPYIGDTLYGRGQSSATINIAQAGTDVFAPDIGNISANTPFIRGNVIPFLIEAPRFVRYTSNPAQAVAAMKRFFEVHTRTITGLNQTRRVESADSPWGGSGERINSPTNVTREVSTPNHGGWELQGRAITKFIAWWIAMAIGDENTKVPRIISNSAIRAVDYNQSFFGATVLYVEPDATLTNVVSAYLCANMYPTATPDWESGKDVSTLGQNLEFNTEFTAVTDVGMGTQRFAQKLLNDLTLKGMNPNDLALDIESIAADVKRAQVGTDAQLRDAASQRLTTS